MSGNLRVAVATLLLCAAPGFAASVYNYSGTFKADDEIQLFYYSLQNQAQVNVFTTSYAGGGFSPVITVFDATGLFQTSGDERRGVALLGFTTRTGLPGCVDAVPILRSALGFTDGFTQQGQGNFTAQPPFNPPLPADFTSPGACSGPGCGHSRSHQPTTRSSLRRRRRSQDRPLYGWAARRCWQGGSEFGARANQE